MNWTQFLDETVSNLGKLQAETPETFAGFNAMGKAAKKPGALDEKPKNLSPLALRLRPVATVASGFTSNHWCA